MRRALAIAALLITAAIQAHANVLRLNVNDMIHPISDEFIGRALDQAQREHDDAVIIVLSTPGGLLDSTRSIVEKIMTSPAITVDRSEQVLSALSLMTKRRIRHLPVVEGGRIIGIVSIGDLVKYRMDKIERQAADLLNYIQNA